LRRRLRSLTREQALECRILNRRLRLKRAIALEGLGFRPSRTGGAATAASIVTGLAGLSQGL
jgi:hypothetical protein